MRLPMPAAVLLLAFLAGAADAQTDAGAALTLAEAMRLAESASPIVRAREAQLAAAEGTRREAAAPLFNNPELSLERGRRRAPGASSSDWSGGVAQPIEIGGQQARRREASAADLDALRAEIDDARRQARGDAALRFHAVLAAQGRMRVEQRSLELFESTAQAVAKRRAAGEDTRLDANVATLESERARNALAAAREQWLDARSELASALQLPPAALPAASGEADAALADALPYDLDRLLAAARQQPKLRALAAREQAARARLGVERAGRYPDVTVGLNVAREGPGDDRERITTLSLSVPLPLWKRNDAAIGQALSDVAQAEVERVAAEREAQAQVRRLWSRLESQRERVRRLRQTVLPTAADSLQLSIKSRAAGQIGLLDLLAVNRQTLDAERDLNEALAELRTTRAELEIAAGWSQEGS
jgi:cobalt-zinc-cadmium efflux system outer membrane protein